VAHQRVTEEANAVLAKRFILSCWLSLVFSCVLPAMSEPAMDAGLQYFKKRDWRSATFYFEQAVKNSPWDSTAMYYLALSYQQSGYPSKAKTIYTQIVDKYPRSTVAAHAKAALQTLKLASKSATKSGATAASKGTGSSNNVKNYLQSRDRNKTAAKIGTKSGK
jgi:tetratricopeptide (TPR) repeat protein